jgi:hypothetical protein
LLFFWPNDLPSLALFALTIAAGFGDGVIGRTGRIWGRRRQCPVVNLRIRTTLRRPLLLAMSAFVLFYPFAVSSAASAGSPVILDLGSPWGAIGPFLLDQQTTDNS